MKLTTIKRALRILLFLPLPFTLYPLPFALSADWDLGFTITVPFASGEGGNATQKVTAGARLTALDGFDNTWDTVMAMGGTTLTAYMYHPEYAADFQLLARDFRFDSYPKQWDFYVNSDQDGQPVTIAWTLPPAQTGTCLGIALALTDVTGGGAAVDLVQPSYQYTNSLGVPRHFQLTATQTVEAPPFAPSDLYSPRVGSASVLLSWTGSGGALAGYHVYRKDPGALEYQRRTGAPVAVVKYLDADVAPGTYSYLITAVSATGCESGPSNEFEVKVGQ